MARSRATTARIRQCSSAIADARRRNITVMLVTGRILDDLRRVAGDLRFVDGVVAENGAVVHFPAPATRRSWHHRSLTFVARLEELGIPFGAANVWLTRMRASAHRMLDVIRELELPIVLSFNRSRVMALAQGVSKATGLVQPWK